MASTNLNLNKEDKQTRHSIRDQVSTITDSYIYYNQNNNNKNYYNKVITDTFKVEMYTSNNIQYQIEEAIKNNEPYMNINECIASIRKYYNITEETEIPIQKIEWQDDILYNNNDDNSSNLNKKLNSDVQYNFYHPLTGEKIDLFEVCEDSPIELRIPVDISKLNLTLIEDFQPQRVNLYDKEDDFYTSNCVTYINETSGAEVPLSQRRERIFPGISFECSNGCTFTGFDDNYYQICDCRAVNSTTTSEDVNILTAIESSNLNVFICIDKAFNANTLKSNPGFYVNLFVLFGAITSIIIYQCIAVNPILSNFKEVIRNDASIFGVKDSLLNINSEIKQSDENVKYKRNNIYYLIICIMLSM